MASVLVWSERPEPNATSLKDCAYSSALMGLVFGGFTKFPAGIYTVAEREALERSDDQPNETGASLDDIILAVKRRYDISWVKRAVALLDGYQTRSDLGFVLTGLNGNLPVGHPLRRHDPGFTGGHAIFIVPTGDGIHVRWLDPLAPNKSAGDLTDWATVKKWMGSAPSMISVRADAYAPLIYTEAQMRVVKAELATTKSEITLLKSQLVDTKNLLSVSQQATKDALNRATAAEVKIANAKAALG